MEVIFDNNVFNSPVSQQINIIPLEKQTWVLVLDTASSNHVRLNDLNRRTAPFKQDLSKLYILVAVARIMESERNVATSEGYSAKRSMIR